MGLKESTQVLVNSRRKWLNEAIEASRRVDELPLELQELEGELDINGETTVSLSLSTFSNRGKDLLRICKTAGIQGLTPRMNSNKYWSAMGVGVLPNGDTLNVTISSLQQPASCTIEEHTELVTKYKAVCSQTGEEL